MTVKLYNLDANGNLYFPNVPGGGGPFTAYYQVVAEDGSLPQGYAISNALQLDFLP